MLYRIQTRGTNLACMSLTFNNLMDHSLQLDLVLSEAVNALLQLVYRHLILTVQLLEQLFFVTC